MTEPIIPDEQWLPCTPTVTSAPGARTPQLLTDVVAQFGVTTKPRYHPSPNATYCNIFVQDVMAAMGAPLPRETTANLTLQRLVAGELRPWQAAKGDAARQAAVAAARAGKPALMGWYNPKGTHGHVAVLLPTSVGMSPMIAQAGQKNFLEELATKGFSAAKLVEIIWAWAD